MMFGKESSSMDIDDQYSESEDSVDSDEYSGEKEKIYKKKVN